MAEKTSKQIPPLKLDVQFQALREEILERIAAVCASGHYILGPELAKFENDFAQAAGVRHAAGCASGSDALILSLMALGVSAGDEVIVPGFTFFATAGSAARIGARPVFADIDPATFTIDPASLESKITKKTKAIIPVHLYGQMCDMDRILKIAAKHGIPVIEDCAQSQGSKLGGKKAGAFGAAGCFSFYPTKNLGAFGDAGLITTSDEKLDKEFRMLRMHGASKKYHHDKVGMNSRLDEIQAAILNVKMKYLDGWLEERRQKAQFYTRLIKEKGLRHVTPPSERPGSTHTFHQYVLRAEKRDALMESLNRQGIGATVYYPVPLHLEKAFAHLGHRAGELPQTEKASKETLALPIYPEISEDDQIAVIEALESFYKAS